MESITIQRNGTNSMNLKSGTISRFLVSFEFASKPLAYDFSLANLTVQLNRNNQGSATILAGNLDVLPLVDKVNTAELLPLQRNGNVYFIVDLPVPINLRGTDTMNVRMQGGNVGTIADMAAVDYNCTVTACSGVGVEVYTPEMHIFQLPAGQNNFSQSFGDFVSHITLLSPTDKVLSLQIESRFYNEVYNQKDLYALAVSQYSNPYDLTGFDLNNMNVNLYSPCRNHQKMPLDGVRVYGQVNLAVTGNVYVAVWRGKTNYEVQSHSEALAKRITSEQRSSIPVSTLEH